MPFTPTHILAIIPIFYINRRFSLVALAIGTMIPDFPMFFPFSSYDFSHSLVGLVFYCVPVGFILYFLFESIGKQFVIDISPQWVRSRLIPYRHNRPSLYFINILLLASAFFIGSASHLIWDSFTHHWGWGVITFPFLQQTIDIFSFSIAYYKLIQYGSTFIGFPLLLIIGIIYLLKFESKKLITNYNFSKIKIYSITLSFLLIPIILSIYYWWHKLSLFTIISYTIPESIGVGITLFFIYALLYGWKRYRSAHLTSD